MIIKMLLVADPLLVPADGVQVGGGGVGRPAEHLQHQRVEPATIITMMMMMTIMMMMMMTMVMMVSRCEVERDTQDQPLAVVHTVEILGNNYYVIFIVLYFI